MYSIRAIEETELTQIPEQIFLRQIGYISISHLGYTLYVLSTVNRAHNLLDILCATIFVQKLNCVIASFQYDSTLEYSYV